MSQVHFQAPPLTKINKALIIAAVVCFLLESILKAVGAFSLPQVLGLSGSGIFSGLVFQFLTYPFIETQLMGVLFNSLIIWFIGSELESNWGQKIYLRFLLINVLMVGLVYFLVSTLFLFGTTYYFLPLHGLSGVNFALLIAYATLYPDRQMSFMMIFPVTSRTFCWILVAIEAYMAVFTSFKSAWAHLLAMGISYLIIRYQNRPLVKKALNSSWKAKKPGKRHLHVVKDDEPKPPKYWQ
jgi:membrane associated rhomboid family serine protease